MSTSFDFNKMIQALGDYAQQVQTEMGKLQQATGGTVDLKTMMTLQYKMQVMGQFVEATSSALSALHQSMMGMARAVKGQ